MTVFLEISSAGIQESSSLHGFFGELKKMTEHAARRYHFGQELKTEHTFHHSVDHKDFVAEHLHDYILGTLEHFVKEHHEIARYFAAHVLERCEQVMALHGGKTFDDAQKLHERVFSIHEKLEQLFQGGEESSAIFMALAHNGADFSRLQNPEHSLMDSIHLGHEIVDRVQTSSQTSGFESLRAANDNGSYEEKTEKFWAEIKDFAAAAVKAFHLPQNADVSSHSFLNEDCLQPENQTRIITFLDHLSDNHPEISLYFAKYVLDFCDTFQESEEHRHHALVLKQSVQKLSDQVKKVMEWKSTRMNFVLPVSSDISAVVAHAHQLLRDIQKGESVLTGMFYKEDESSSEILARH